MFVTKQDSKTSSCRTARYVEGQQCDTSLADHVFHVTWVRPGISPDWRRKMHFSQWNWDTPPFPLAPALLGKVREYSCLCPRPLITAARAASLQPKQDDLACQEEVFPYLGRPGGRTSFQPRSASWSNSLTGCLHWEFTWWSRNNPTNEAETLAAFNTLLITSDCLLLLLPKGKISLSTPHPNSSLLCSKPQSHAFPCFQHWYSNLCRQI